MNLSKEICEPGLEEFLQEFLSDRKEEVSLLVGQNIADVQSSARDIGHKWQGFSRPYGFLYLEGLGQRLCDAAKDLNQISFEDILSEAKDYLNQKEEILKG